MALVLLVDDDELLLEALAAYLESRGHKVTRCCDSSNATELAEKIAPDLAIVDYEMPRLTGTQLLSEFRGGGRTHFLPVLFLSGVEPLTYTSQIAPDARVRFLQKPVDFDELDGAIASLLDPEGWSKNS